MLVRPFAADAGDLDFDLDGLSEGSIHRRRRPGPCKRGYWASARNQHSGRASTNAGEPPQPRELTLSFLIIIIGLISVHMIDQHHPKSSPLLAGVHLGHLLGLALAESYVPLARGLVELPPACGALDHAAGLLGHCLLLSSQLLSSTCLQACSECCALLLPLRNLLFLRPLLGAFRVFFSLGHLRWGLEIFDFGSSMGS